MGYEIVITFNETAGLADGMGTVSTQPAEPADEVVTLDEREGGDDEGLPEPDLTGEPESDE